MLNASVDHVSEPYEHSDDVSWKDRVDAVIYSLARKAGGYDWCRHRTARSAS